MSRGICNYHFQTKDQLLLESFLSLYHEHQQTWRGIVRSGSLAPAKRLTMLVHALLTPPLAEHGKLAVWTAFWGSPHYRRIYIDLCTEGDSLYEKGVASLLKELADGRNTVKGLSLHTIAVSLTALIAGCHLQYLIAPGRLTPEDAEDACRSYLCHFFPDAFAKNDYRKP